MYILIQEADISWCSNLLPHHPRLKTACLRTKIGNAQTFTWCKNDDLWLFLTKKKNRSLACSKMPWSQRFFLGSKRAAKWRRRVRPGKEKPLVTLDFNLTFMQMPGSGSDPQARICWYFYKHAYQYDWFIWLAIPGGRVIAKLALVPFVIWQLASTWKGFKVRGNQGIFSFLPLQGWRKTSRTMSSKSKASTKLITKLLFKSNNHSNCFFELRVLDTHHTYLVRYRTNLHLRTCLVLNEVGDNLEIWINCKDTYANNTILIPRVMKMIQDTIHYSAWRD